MCTQPHPAVPQGKRAQRVEATTIPGSTAPRTPRALRVLQAFRIARTRDATIADAAEAQSRHFGERHAHCAQRSPHEHLLLHPPSHRTTDQPSGPRPLASVSVFIDTIRTHRSHASRRYFARCPPLIPIAPQIPGGWKFGLKSGNGLG